MNVYTNSEVDRGQHIVSHLPGHCGTNSHLCVESNKLGHSDVDTEPRKEVNAARAKSAVATCSGLRAE